MSKARLHPTMLDFRGAMGEMVFRRHKGQLLATIKSIGTEKEPTENQVAHRERFDEAVQYGKRALAKHPCGARRSKSKIWRFLAPIWE